MGWFSNKAILGLLVLSLMRGPLVPLLIGVVFGGVCSVRYHGFKSAMIATNRYVDAFILNNGLTDAEQKLKEIGENGLNESKNIIN